MQLHEQILKQQAGEKCRTERRARHMQDNLHYAMKKLSEPLATRKYDSSVASE
jgi:pre-mRNA-processing factor 40